MYDEPDWSSLSVAELLEKAQEFAKQAYQKSLSSYAFISRALDRMPVGTKGGEELAELMGKAQQVYQTIVEVQQTITHITDTLSQIRRTTLPCLLLSSGAKNTAYRFIRDTIVTCNFSEWFALVDAF
jgi:hypothetical protein